jgi:cation:H+ antiporter
LGFLCSSLLMLGCLNHLERKGFEGTAIGTMIMPFCSGAPNLVFATVMARSGGPGREVLINCLVNNITNLSLLIGLPCLLWRLEIIARRKTNKESRLNRLSLALTLIAVFVFSGGAWILGEDKKLDRSDGIVLIGLFLFWQSIHLIEVLKTNITKSRKMGFWIVVDMLLLAGAVFLMFHSIDWLENWLSTIKTGFISYQHIGWLSGWLMVLPNALPAFYYAWKRRADIVYSSQVGDGHICIPLCIGLFALFRPIAIPDFYGLAIGLLLVLASVHFLAVLLLGRLPRIIGATLVAAYIFFVYKGFITP